VQINLGDGTIVGDLKAASRLAELDSKPAGAKLYRDAANEIEMLKRALYAALHNVEVGFDPISGFSDVEMSETDDGHLIARRKRT